jgi:hypothetical protein
MKSEMHHLKGFTENAAWAHLCGVHAFNALKKVLKDPQREPTPLQHQHDVSAFQRLPGPNKGSLQA